MPTEQAADPQPDPEPRQILKGFLTPEARRGWRQYTQQHRITHTALLEQLGLLLDDGDASWIPDGVVDRARSLDIERLNRI